MEPTGPAARVYQDFEPSMEWVTEDDSDTLLVYLPGFAKEQLRVQLRAKNLIVSGERKLQVNTWSRFRVEFPVSANCDLNKISAKFEGNILFVRQPKLITITTPAAPVPLPPPPPQKADDDGESNIDQLPEAKPILDSKDQADQVIPNMGLLEAGKIHKGKDNENNAPDKKTSSDDKMNKQQQAVYAELDKTTKTALDNYKRAVGVFATKLKSSTNAVNTIVILLLGLVIGMYVSNSIKSWTKA